MLIVHLSGFNEMLFVMKFQFSVPKHNLVLDVGE